MSIFKGAGVAIVTPMKNNEEVNYDRLEQMIEYQINQGTDCIIIAGTTGESSTLPGSALRFRVLPFSSETEISPTRPSILSS